VTEPTQTRDPGDDEARDPRDKVLDAALPHVAFDGWSERTLKAAAQGTGMPLAEARALFPRGGVDLALAYHRRGDARMIERLQTEPLDALRFRDRIAAAIRWRLEAADREAVRRGATLFALPQHAADGSRAVWGTVDAIWTTLGDRSDDFNWYSKRATLAGVYGATVLYWLGDDSLDHQATWSFLDRRIDDVMQVEKAKARIRETPVLRTLFAGPGWLLGRVRAPQATPPADLPGYWRAPVQRSAE